MTTTMRRVFKWILIGLGCLLVIVVIAVQAVLWSDLPRQILVPAVQKKIGLRLEVDTLSTGWLGHTTLRNVRVALPLKNKPFLVVPTLKLDHHNLVLLAITRSLGLNHAAIRQPRLLLRQQPDGGWNLQQAQRILQAHLAQAAPHSSDAPPALPGVDITQARITLAPNHAPPITIRGGEVHGSALSVLHYKLMVKAPAVGGAKADLLSAPPYQHTASFDVQPQPALLKEAGRMLGRSVPSLSVKGDWRGNFSAGVASGRLNLTRAAVGANAASGEAAIAFDMARKQLTVQPRRLKLKADAAPKPIFVTGGSLRYAVGKLAHIDQLTLAGFGLRAALTGRLDPTQQTGRLTAHWQSSTANRATDGRRGRGQKPQPPAGAAQADTPRASFQHSGEAAIALSRTPLGERQAHLEVRTTGESPLIWRVHLDASVQGPSWTDLTGRVAAATLRVTRGGRTLDLSGLTTRLTYANQQFDASNLHLTGAPPSDAEGSGAASAPSTSQPSPDASAAPQTPPADGETRGENHAAPAVLRPRRVSGSAHFNQASKQWNAQFATQGLAIPGLPVSLDRVTLDATGNARGAVLNNAAVDALGVELQASGTYLFHNKTSPLSLTVKLADVPANLAQSLHLTRPVRLSGGKATQKLKLAAKKLTGQLTINGALLPYKSLHLTTGGHLLAQSLRVRDKVLGDIRLKVGGFVNPQKLHLTANAPQWLGGSWGVRADLNRRGKKGVVWVKGDDLDLSLIQQIVAMPGQIQGLGAVNVRIDIPRASPGDFLAQGDISAKQLAATYSLARVHADRMSAKLKMDHRALKLSHVRAFEGKSVAGADIAVPFDKSKPARVDARLKGWPIRAPRIGAVVRLSGTLGGGAILATRRITAHTNLHTQFQLRKRDLGYLNLDTALAAGPDQRRLTLNQLAGRLLGGQVAGQGVLNLEQPPRSRLTLKWRGLEPGRLQRWVAQASNIKGGFSGSVRAHPATVAHPLGPLQFDASLDASRMTVHGIALGTGSARAFYSKTKATGPRMVLQEAHLAGAGGRLGLWGRVTREPPRMSSIAQDREWMFFAKVNADQLNLKTISRALRPRAAPFLGRFSGNLTLNGPLKQWRQAHGQAAVDIRQSDLADVPLFGDLYDLLSLNVGGHVPEGRGHGNLRLEEGKVTIPQFQYDNRGVRLRLALTLADLWKAKRSPISGFATASASPLPKWQFLESANEVLGGLESNLTTIRIGGMLGKPKVEIAPFQSLGAAFSGILGGDDQDQQ